MPLIEHSDVEKRRGGLAFFLFKAEGRWFTVRRLIRQYGRDLGYGDMLAAGEVMRRDLAALEAQGLVRSSRIGKAFSWSAKPPNS